MPIRVVCPQGHKILAPESRAGKRILCPRCRSELRVPLLEPPADPTQETGAKPPPTVNYDPVASREQKLAAAKKAASQKISDAKKQRWKGDPSEGSGIGIDQKQKPSKSTSRKKQVDAKKPSKPAKEASPKQVDHTPASPAAEDSKPPPRGSPPPLPGKRNKPLDKAAETAAAAGPPPAKEPPQEKIVIRFESPEKREPPAKQTTSSRKSAEPEPASTEPASTEPASTEPASTEPASTEPASTESTGKIAQRQRASSEPVAAAETTAAEQPQFDTLPGEQLAEPGMPVVGVRHRSERVRTVYLLAVVLAGLACFGVVPSVMEWLDYMRSEGEQPLARWVWFSLVISGVQLAYAIYLAQLPDWSSVWATAIAALACAMLYAMLYAVTLLGDANSTLLTWLEIHATQTSRASGWCFVMLSITGIFAYFCGRAGAAWRHSEQMRASLGLK